MKIAAISDLHSPGKLDFDFYQALKQLSGLELDIFILAGDVASSNELVETSLANVEKYMAKLNIAVKHKLYVPGNHDLYARENKQFLGLFQKTPNTFDIYDGLRAKVKIFGYHMLDADPIIIDGVGFAGSMGWYDYSFAKKTDLEVVVNGQIKTLAEFKDEDYAVKTAQCNGKQMTWPDKDRIFWNDKQAAKKLIAQLQTDIEQIRTADKQVVVIHFVPFEQNVGDYKRPFMQYTAAYMGSKDLGDILLSNHIDTVIHGHAHASSGGYNINGISCYNVSLNSRKPEILITDC